MNEPARFRLDNSLERAGLAAQVSSAPGPAAVASPLRRATEWQGFELTLDGRPSYAKVLQEDMWPVIDPARSAEASDQAARAGAAPALLYADAEQGVLVFEALPAGEWRWARVHELLSGERLEALFSLKRAVHQGAVSGFQRSPADDIRHLLWLCQRDAVQLPLDTDWINACVDMAWSALAASGWNSCSIHGDGVASNVMLGPGGQLRLVDFDRGGAFDPWYDVATTLNELYQLEDEWRLGLEIWAGCCTEPDYARCRLYALIDDWLWTLWGLWAGTTSSRSVEFSKVGQWTLLRTREALRDHRFEHWLRQV